MHYIAVTEPGHKIDIKVVAFKSNLEGVIYFNGVPTRSIYDLDTIEETAKRLTQVKFGKITSWEKFDE